MTSLRCAPSPAAGRALAALLTLVLHAPLLAQGLVAGVAALQPPELPDPGAQSPLKPH